MNQNGAKQAAATAAAELIEDGTTVGLGTGSTAAFFIKALITRQKKGLRVQVVATSESSAQLAKEGGIPVLDFDDVDLIDITVDGADEIDSRKQMIKGGGGALLREKLVATSSKEMVVIVDNSKVVDTLGSFGLPLEIVPFGHQHTLRAINRLGYNGRLRMNHDTPFLTDNGNYIVDLAFDSPLTTPEEDHRMLIALPGVIETGLFLGIAGRVLVGSTNGKVDVWE